MNIREAGNKFNKSKVLKAITDTLNAIRISREDSMKFLIEKHRHKIVGFFNRKVLIFDEDIIDWLKETDNIQYYVTKRFKDRTEEYLRDLHKYVSNANDGENFVCLTPDQYNLIQEKYTNN